MTDELIKQFFEKKCTAPEAAEVSQYLKDHPEVMEKYLPASEWFDVSAGSMPTEFWNEQWMQISSRRKSSRKMVWISRAAAAAVVILTAAVAYNYFYTADKPAIVASIKHTVAPSPEKKIIVNNSSAVMELALPDSSIVQLSTGSVITYYIPFDINRRDITLDGEGRFKVKRNEHKPFTVFAGGLATTALGTEFTINTKNNVSVQLHTGKVVIVATGEAARHWTKQVILKPGQQLSFNSKAMTAAVGPIKIKNSIARNTVSTQKKLIAAEGPVLNFENASLPDVLTRLSDYYHEIIIFDRDELDDMNFTGTISKNDSLKVVLAVIAQMNKLEVSRDDHGYALKKQNNKSQ